MNTDNILKAANVLFQNKLNGTGINNLPSNCIPQNNDEAYKIQNELKILCLALKDNLSIGKKVGCTNKEAQKQINITEPFYGNIFSNYSSESNCVIKTKDFIEPFLEPEFSFKLNGM